MKKVELERKLGDAQRLLAPVLQDDDLNVYGDGSTVDVRFDDEEKSYRARVEWVSDLFTYCFFFDPEDVENIDCPVTEAHGNAVTAADLFDLCSPEIHVVEM